MTQSFQSDSILFSLLDPKTTDDSSVLLPVFLTLIKFPSIHKFSSSSALSENEMQF